MEEEVLDKAAGRILRDVWKLDQEAIASLYASLDKAQTDLKIVKTYITLGALLGEPSLENQARWINHPNTLSPFKGLSPAQYLAGTSEDRVDKTLQTLNFYLHSGW
jgi:hypothetical protein